MMQYLSFVLMLGAITAPAYAKPTIIKKIIDGAWFDGLGGEVRLYPNPGPEFEWDPLTPSDRPATEVVALFKEACLDQIAGPAVAAKVIATRNWGFHRLGDNDDYTIGEPLIGWQASDVSISSLGRAWPLSECNVVLAQNKLSDIDVISSQISSALQTQPDKQYKSTKKSIVAEARQWRRILPSGEKQRVIVSVVKNILGLNYSYLHLGITGPCQKKAS